MEYPEVRSHVPGRVRLCCPHHAAESGRRISELDGVLEVRVNPVTDSVVVRYDPACIELTAIRQACLPAVAVLRRRPRRLSPLAILSVCESIVRGHWPALLESLLLGRRGRRLLARAVGPQAALAVRTVQVAAGLAMAESPVGLLVALLEAGKVLSTWARRLRPMPMLAAAA